MLISRDKKFVFVHVPKTGGDSVSRALADVADIDGSAGNLKHWSARRICNSMFPIGDQNWSDFLSFGVIRNPWEQVHSDYHFCRSHPVPPESVGGWRDKVVRCKQISFAEFVVDMCGQHGRAGSGLFAHYLADRSGNQMVTQVLRHERLAEDFAGICQSLSLPTINLPRVNVTRGRPGYRDEYDDRSRFLVSRKFADDIERFDYTFGE